jgi:hypothetical protein
MRPVMMAIPIAGMGVAVVVKLNQDIHATVNLVSVLQAAVTATM